MLWGRRGCSCSVGVTLVSHHSGAELPVGLLRALPFPNLRMNWSVAVVALFYSTSSSSRAPSDGEAEPSLFSSLSFCKIFQDFSLHRIFGRMHEALNINKKKLITQFRRNSRDESFKSN